MLVPSYGGTAAGTLNDFEPLFQAITASNGLHFRLAVGTSYPAVVEAMANNQVDIAWFGMISYLQARQRNAAELLAVAVDRGSSSYTAAIYVRADSGIKQLTDLRGKRVAFGDPSSTSGFNVPVAMLIAAGVHPVRDLGGIVIADSHAAALAELAKGRVDAACANCINFDRAVREGALKSDEIVPLAESDPIPNPPLAMHPRLPEDLKKVLRQSFHTLHQNPAVKPEMIRGEGNKVYERYDAEYAEEQFDAALKSLECVTDDLKQAMLQKAQNR